MGLIRYGAALRALVAVKGHPYARDAFAALFESIPELDAVLVEQPAAMYLLESAAPFDLFVFYDMPGIDFAHRPPRYVPPPSWLPEAFAHLAERGAGMLFLHHAIAAWPTWDEYGEIVGGRFLYLPGRLADRLVADSGYLHSASYTARVLREHPVTAGLPPTFPLSDELYLYPVFEEAVLPLLAADFEFTPERFHSAAAAVGAAPPQAPWRPDYGSRLLSWVHAWRGAPVVYLQPGDGPEIFADAHYRRLVANAVRWLASAEARAFARDRGAGRIAPPPAIP